MRYLLVVFAFLILSTLSVVSQTTNHTLTWEIKTEHFSDTESKSFLYFNGAIIDAATSLPKYFQKIDLPTGFNNATASLSNIIYSELSPSEVSFIKTIPENIVPNVQIGYERKLAKALITFIPIRKNSTSGNYEKIVSFTITINPIQNASQLKQINSVAKTNASASVLATGNWYKIGVTKDGVYKLSQSFLKNIGIDVDAVNPKNIRIYGNGGGQLPYANSEFRRDDLTENAIMVSGENDNKLDATDYVLFYGQSQSRWKYVKNACPEFQHNINKYTDTTYYFITTDLGAGKRILPQTSTTLPATHTVTTFDDYAFIEDESVNLIRSGREWFGSNFDILTSYTYNFNFPNIDNSSAAKIKVDLASRNAGNSSYAVTSGSTTQNIFVSPVNTSLYYAEYAADGATCMSSNNPSSNLSVTVSKQTAAAVGWLNYIEVNVRRQLSMNGDQLLFRDKQSVGVGNIATYNITGSSTINVWEISDPTTVKEQRVVSNSFSLAADSLREFIAFTGASFLTPAFSGTVANQNLHSLAQQDMIIVTHPLFMNEATTLANHHISKDNLTVTVVTPQQVYNEFSSGAQDASAIRDFMKMFYDRATNYADEPKYLLLLGDGSYDNKNRLASNTNFIPTYQSLESFDPITSYVSDDYYGQLDDSEGRWAPSDPDLVDIGVGRIPAKNTSEAQDVVNKIIKYSTVPGVMPSTAESICSNTNNNSPLGDWRNVISFIGDDEDGNMHVSQSNQLSNVVAAKYRNFNFDKIFLDAYPQLSTPGGSRYPDVNTAINNRVDKGALVINYSGHGGELGLTHERVVGISDIQSWDNLYKLPLFVTATCEFSRFDNPQLNSAGEDVLLNPNGGGIGLLTTVRLVYAFPNFLLNTNFYNHFMDTLPDGELSRIGDLYRLTKVSSGVDVNNRNFTLLGDPAVRLAYPKYNIVTDSINGNKLSFAITDTLKALSKVTITGRVTQPNGSTLNTYNGFLYPTVFDKSVDAKTLANDGGSTFTFKQQKNILYRGVVSVTNGEFKFSFIVPKDIAYNYGIGRISYYTQNGTTDGAGFSEKIYIGGTNPTAAIDNNGPAVQLYMNDIKFAFGGTTDETPFIYSIMKDSSGINTVGNGIGHDITATLDNKSEDVIVLNDFYQADLNSFKSGTVRYQLKNLTEGKHTLKVKAWDIYNNSSDAYTEFIVAKSASLALNRVLNYPNPFTTKTSFFFEHNKCCDDLEVQVQIFTVSGKVVKTINTRINSEGFRSDPIDWDGKDDFGDPIGRGVYIYQLKIRSSDGSSANKFEKLVILN